MASAVIFAVRSTSGDQPTIARTIEKLTQTFVAGVPVQIDAVDGGVKEWDGVTVANAIAGFAKEAGSNLTTTGIAKTLSFGSVPFQSAALNIPRGAPPNDGKILYETAAPHNVFSGQVGPAQLTVATDVGKQYGMTKDTDGHWFIDRTKTGAAAVVRIERIDPNDPVSSVSRGVHFTVLLAAAQIVAG